MFPTPVDQLQKVIQGAKRNEFKEWEDLICMIVAHPLAYCSDTDDRLFLQFNITQNVKNIPQRIIGWGHPDLIFELNHATSNTPIF